MQKIDSLKTTWKIQFSKDRKNYVLDINGTELRGPDLKMLLVFGAHEILAQARHIFYNLTDDISEKLDEYDATDIFLVPTEEILY